jgi:hypothetical protein
VSTHYFRLIRRGAPKGRRSRLLERLLAGADSSSAVGDWRADAFRVIAPMTAMPGIGAAALCAERERVAGGAVAAGAMVSPATAAGSVFVATPVHYVADMSSVRLPADGILSLRQAEAEALAVDFNRVWHDAGVRLIAGHRADLLCAADQPITVASRDPEDVLDQSIETHLPTGAAGPRLRGLMSEIELWLFEHAVNGARTSGGAPAVNGLWLWGGGPALTSLPPVAGWTAGEDVFFRAFESAPGSPHAGSSAVLVIDAEPGMDQWRKAETWLESSVAELGAGRIDGIKLSAGNRCFSVSARWRRRFWRRSKSWQEYFE